MGGGGAGGANNVNGTVGTVNTGGGGGGGGGTSSGVAGGSGIVIFRYLTSELLQANIYISGGTISTSGGYTIHSFTSTGTTTVTVA